MHRLKSETFFVHVLKSGKLNEESGNKIKHEMHAISRKGFESQRPNAFYLHAPCSMLHASSVQARVLDLFDDEVFGFEEGGPGLGFFWNEGLPSDALEVRRTGVGDLDGVEKGGLAGDGEFVVAQFF